MAPPPAPPPTPYQRGLAAINPEEQGGIGLRPRGSYISLDGTGVQQHGVNAYNIFANQTDYDENWEPDPDTYAHLLAA